MRDLAITALILALLPLAMARPYVGIVLWTWISVMNPHRLTWSFAYEFPFALIVAIATLVGMAINWNKWRFPVNALTTMLIAFMLWMTVTLVFAFHFTESLKTWTETAKMILMTLVALAVVKTEKDIRLFVWVLVFSVVFFGIKGGIFTLLGGGEGRVYGPPDSYIGDNNAISVALVMMIPLVVYLIRVTRHPAIRIGLIASIVLSLVSVIGSYSRGAALAAVGMLLALMLKFRRAWAPLIVIIALLPFAIVQMPEQWYSRIESIGRYQEDASVQGRFNAWNMAWNLALDRPIVGGGFAVDNSDVFALYAPLPDDVHSAHSIYFQMLGQHGFVGLALFLAIGFLMWRTGSRVIATTKGDANLRWAGDLARAVQVSMIGYALGGISVNIGYWDVIYYELVVLVALERLVNERRTQAKEIGSGEHSNQMNWNIGVDLSGPRSNAPRRRDAGSTG